MSGSLTMVVINWMRPLNIQAVVECLDRQTLRPRIFLWNNCQTPFKVSHPAAAARCDVVVDSSHNLNCDVWAAMSILATSKFVGKLDDDLVLTDNRVLADCCQFMEQQPWDRIVGTMGVSLHPKKPYPDGGRHFDLPPATDQMVDVVKGRFWIFYRQALQEAPVKSLGHDGDITLSAWLAKGRKDHHVLPGFMHNRTKNLPEGPEALFAQPGHKETRERLRREWFPF